MAERVRMECPKCGYKCTPQWLNDEAHCLKCQAVLRKRAAGTGAGAGVPVANDSVRQAGEVSTFKHAAGSAMESIAGNCRTSPDGLHHWKYGKCNYCQRPEPPKGRAAAAVPQRGEGAKVEPKCCNKCRKPYRGHGDTCGACRLVKKGSSVQCRVCGGFFFGYGDICDDCRELDIPSSGAMASSSSDAVAVPVGRNERIKMECPKCNYKCVPQWLNDEAHCLKCQAVLMIQPTIHGTSQNMNFSLQDESRRQPGEVSTFKYASGNAMESVSGDCAKSPDGLHHWKFGKCNYCQKSEGKQVRGAGVVANPGSAGGCAAGGKCMFKFAKCSKCGRKEF